jgi:hypothetical protein
MSASGLATNKYFPLAHSDLARATWSIRKAQTRGHVCPTLFPHNPIHTLTPTSTSIAASTPAIAASDILFHIFTFCCSPRHRQTYPKKLIWKAINLYEPPPYYCEIPQSGFDRILFSPFLFTVEFSWVVVCYFNQSRRVGVADQLLLCHPSAHTHTHTHTHF